MRQRRGWGTGWGRKATWAALGVTCLLGGIGIRAWSQEDAFKLLNGAIVGPQTAYVPLRAEWVCGNHSGHVSVSPDATDALIFQNYGLTVRSLQDLSNQEQVLTQRLEQGTPMESNLLLWSFDSRRPVTVWRGGGSLITGMASPFEAQWLTGTRTAILKVMVVSPLTPEQIKVLDHPDVVKRTLTFVRINAATGKAQTLLTGANENTDVLASPTHPVAVLRSLDSSTMQRIEANGSLGPLLTLTKPEGKKEFPMWLSWLPDGRTLRGILFERKEGEPRSTRTYYRLDTVTGVVTLEQTAPPKETPSTPATETLPFAVRQGRETLSRDDVKTTVYPLWLEGRDKDTTGHTLLTADSDPAFKPILLTGAILYQKSGALYAVPLLKSNAADFLAGRLAAQKAETLKRAKQLGTALLMYAQDYDEYYPPVGSNIKDIVMPYVKNDAIFQNPATGQNGFTPVYTNAALNSVDKPAETPLGYFSGPDGTVVVIYADGHAKWK